MRSVLQLMMTLLNEEKVAELFNKYFINAVQTTVVEAPSEIVV